jgi:hypothetical protein
MAPKDPEPPRSVVLSCSIITQECRKNRGAIAALQGAIRRVEDEYAACIDNPANADKDYRLVLSLIRKD